MSTDVFDDGDVDVSDLRLNFSAEEASSEARSFDALPPGKYHVAIFEIEVRTSKSEKNYGKPYWNVTYVVQDGPYEKQRVWGSVMLFEGALYSLVQLLDATGHGRPQAGKAFKLPSTEEFIGKEVVIGVSKKPKKRDGVIQPGEFNNDVTGIFKYDAGKWKPAQAGAATSASSGGSLLP
jgi:hypothetical protein